MRRGQKRRRSYPKCSVTQDTGFSEAAVTGSGGYAVSRLLLHETCDLHRRTARPRNRETARPRIQPFFGVTLDPPPETTHAMTLALSTLSASTRSLPTPTKVPAMLYE